MINFFLSIFCWIFTTYGVISFWRGEGVFGDWYNVEKLGGIWARIFSGFIAIFFLALIYFGWSNNIFIKNNILVSNLASMFTGILLAVTLYLRSLKISTNSYTRGIEKIWNVPTAQILIWGVLAAFFIYVLWKAIEKYFLK